MTFPRRSSSSGSVALLMVLVTLAILTTVVIEIMYKSKVTESVVVNRRDGEKAYQLARAAVRWSIFRLQLDNALDQIPVIPGTNYGGKKDDLSEIQWAMPLPYPFSAGAVKAAAENSAPAAKPEEAANDIGGSFVTAISDESSKINLNDVASGSFGGMTQWSGAALVLENLLLSPRFKPFFRNSDYRTVLWAIDDWTDFDSNVNHTGGGIEDVEYQTEDRNLHVKNGALYSLEEVRLLKPMTDDLFRELEPFVTVYPFDARLPRMSNILPPFMGPINVNTAPVEILAALFSRDAIPEYRERLRCAQELAKARAIAAFRSKTGTQPAFLDAVRKLCPVRETGAPGTSVNGIPNNVANILSARSDTFSVEATGSVSSTEKTIRTVISRANSQKPKLLFWKVI